MKNFIGLLAIVALLINTGCSTGGTEDSAVSDSEFSEALGDTGVDTGDDGFGDEADDFNDFGDDQAVSDSDSSGEEGFDDFNDFEEGDSETGEQDEFAEFEDSGDEFAEFEESGDEFADDSFGDEFTEDDFGDEQFAENEEGFDDFESFEEQPQDEFAMEEPAPAPAPVEQPVVEQPVEEMPEPVAPAPIIEEPTYYASGNRVQNIEFRANDNNGTVVIETAQPVKYLTRINKETSQFFVEMSDVSMPDSLKRPFITKDFKTPFAAIQAYQNPGSTTARVIVQMKDGMPEPIVQAEGNRLIVIPVEGVETTLAKNPVEPVAPAQPTQPEKPNPDSWSYDTKAAAQDSQALQAKSLEDFLSGNTKFYGRRISIETRSDTDIKDVLNLIAEQGGINMVLSDEVAGSIRLKLRDVPWDQALMIVLKSKGLGYVRQGNVVRISSLASLRSEVEQAQQVLKAQQTLSPLRVKIIAVSYAKASELQAQVTPFLTKSRGSVTVDPRSNSLIVTDTDTTLVKVEKLIDELDVPPAQVMIEAKIIEATEDFSNIAGISWNAGGQAIELSDSGGLNGVPINLVPTISSSPSSGGSAIGSIGLSFGTVDIIGDINASLAFAETQSIAKIISSPRILAINNESAQITQNGEVFVPSFVQQTGSSATTTPIQSFQSRSFSLSLDVTPQITADSSVIMQVAVTRQFPGAPVGDQPAPINSRSAKTKIIVKHGETAVIGGIYQNDESIGEQGVPVLKDIPILGWLFRSTQKTKQKNELMVFLTPRIVSNERPGLRSRETEEAVTPQPTQAEAESDTDAG